MIDPAWYCWIVVYRFLSSFWDFSFDLFKMSQESRLAHGHPTADFLSCVLRTVEWGFLKIWLPWVFLQKISDEWFDAIRLNYRFKIYARIRVNLRFGNGKLKTRIWRIYVLINWCVELFTCLLMCDVLYAMNWISHDYELNNGGVAGVSKGFQDLVFSKTWFFMHLTSFRKIVNCCLY